jgi:hypothetical protein
MHEFVRGDLSPVPRRGFTSIEAAEFLKRELPEVKAWTCWDAGDTAAGRSLQKIVDRSLPERGEVRGWRWERVACSYPVVGYWSGADPEPGHGGVWIGMLRLTGAKGEQFYLFSGLSSTGAIGYRYYASTQDVAMLARFTQDVFDHFKPDLGQQIVIEVFGGDPIFLSSEDNERIFLDRRLLFDIEEQAQSFFANRELYERLKLRYRRGFLFVGAPGTGKTMMLRHLVRRTYSNHKIRFIMFTIRRDTDESIVARLFKYAATCAPSMVILEDLDSLTKESRITRSALLQELDGLTSKEGMLIIGTTNNPDEIDPALTHRPSRFDRVWHFPIPSTQLRSEYLTGELNGLSPDVVQEITRLTAGWSFAYLKELRTTASILAMEDQCAEVTEEDALAALELLTAQFNAGKKQHALVPDEPSLGFAAA